MGYKRYLTDVEREKIFSMKALGNSIYDISKQIHRSRTTISQFIKDPEGYIRIMIEESSKLGKTASKAGLQLNHSNDTSLLLNSSPKKKSTSTPIKKTPSKSNTNDGQKNIVKKDYNSPSNKKPTEADLKKYNRVPVEHRAVIKFLIKKGIGPRFIFEDLQKVYEKSAPDLLSTLYWAKQYQQGRNTIFNESQNKINVIKHSPKGKAATNNKSNKKSPAANTSKADVKKLFKFKFKPLKRLND